MGRIGQGLRVVFGRDVPSREEVEAEAADELRAAVASRWPSAPPPTPGRLILPPQRLTRDYVITALSQINGLGEARINAVLDAFPSLEALSNAEPAELLHIRGIGHGFARSIVEALRPVAGRDDHAS